MPMLFFECTLFALVSLFVFKDACQENCCLELFSYLTDLNSMFHSQNTPMSQPWCVSDLISLSTEK